MRGLESSFSSRGPVGRGRTQTRGRIRGMGLPASVGKCGGEMVREKKPWGAEVDQADLLPTSQVSWVPVLTFLLCSLSAYTLVLRLLLPFPA